MPSMNSDAREYKHLDITPSELYSCFLVGNALYAATDP